MTLRIVPLELAQANDLVRRLHRHHGAARGHRFSIGAVDDDGRLVGAAIVGRPVARNVPQRSTLEVTRLVTDGTPNACSLLYGAAARAARHLGYHRIQTYVLEEEPATSLRAAGWTLDRLTAPDRWRHHEGAPRRNDHPLGAKQRWSRELNPPAPELVFPEPDRPEPQLALPYA